MWSNCNCEEPLFLSIGTSMLTPGFLEQVTTKENLLTAEHYFLLVQQVRSLKSGTFSELVHSGEWECNLDISPGPGAAQQPSAWHSLVCRRVTPICLCCHCFPTFYLCAHNSSFNGITTVGPMVHLVHMASIIPPVNILYPCEVTCEEQVHMDSGGLFTCCSEHHYSSRKLPNR